MNIYDEAIESIEGLPHTIKVPLRRALRHAKKEHELLGLYREYRKGVIFYIKNSISNIMIDNAIKIDELEKELEEKI